MPAPQGLVADILPDLRRQLRAGDPLPLLSTVSHTLAMTTGGTAATFDDLLTDLIDAPCAETTAALHLVRALATPPERSARVDRELQGRRQPMPGWISDLPQAVAEEESFRLRHVMGDCIDLFIGVRAGDDVSLTARVHISPDHGHEVMAVEVLPIPVCEALDDLRPHLDRQDETLEPIELASARAHLERAIVQTWSSTFLWTAPSVVMNVRLVEWMTRLLPMGGRVPSPPPLTLDHAAVIVDGFLGSRHGSVFHDDGDRGWALAAVKYASMTADRDPFRWSPRSTPRLLDDLTVSHDMTTDELGRVCDIVRALAAHCHEIRGIRSHWTEEVARSVDEWLLDEANGHADLEGF